MNNKLDTKEHRIEYGESAEKWVVNKINSLNLPNWEAEIIYNREDAVKNHCEGDILLKYKIDNYRKILIYIDVKASGGTYDYPVIAVNYKSGKLNESTEYLKNIKHNFYLGIGRYDANLENDTSIEFQYSLGITKDMIKKMLANNCEFINRYKKSIVRSLSDFISMRNFIDDKDKSFMPVGKRTTMKGVIEVIEKYILINIDKNIFKIEEV